MELKDVINKSYELCEEIKDQQVGTEHFIGVILRDIKKYESIFGITYDEYISALNELKIKNVPKIESEMTPMLKGLLINKYRIDEVIAELFLEIESGIAFRIIEEYSKFDIEKIQNNIEREVGKLKGQMPQYVVNLNEKEYLTNPAIGRDILIEEIEKILLKMNKPNVLLLGEAGVGKTSIVEGIVYRIKKGLVNDRLSNVKILSVSSSSIVAGTRYRGDFEKKMEDLCDFLKQNDNVILFIDEMHTTLNAGGSEGGIDMANILKPYLARGDIKVIGATTTKESEIITKDSAYNRRFTKIIVDEPSLTETTNILKESVPKFEKYFDIKIDKKLIDYIVNESKSFKGRNPDKSIDILENVCSDTIWNNEKTFDKKDIKRVIENMVDREKQLMSN